MKTLSLVLFVFITGSLFGGEKGISIGIRRFGNSQYFAQISTHTDNEKNTIHRYIAIGFYPKKLGFGEDRKLGIDGILKGIKWLHGIDVYNNEYELVYDEKSEFFTLTLSNKEKVLSKVKIKARYQLELSKIKQ